MQGRPVKLTVNFTLIYGVTFGRGGSIGCMFVLEIIVPSNVTFIGVHNLLETFQAQKTRPVLATMVDHFSSSIRLDGIINK